MEILAIENVTIGDIKNVLVLFSTIISSGAVLLKFAKGMLKKQLEPFNKRIDETIENNNRKFDELNKKVDFNDIDVVRRSISAFDNLCRLDINNEGIQMHQYNTVFKDIDKWAMYHQRYPELNGEINSAIENIKEHYKKAKF